MANQPIPTLPVAITLDGTEQMELVQPAGSGGTSKRATTGQIAALGSGLPTTIIPALSVVGNPTNVAATSTAIIGAAGQVFRVDDLGASLGFGQVDLSNTASVTAILSVPHGGSGTGSLTAYGVVVGNGTSPVTVTAPGTNGQALLGQTSTSDPQFVTVGGDLTLTGAGTATVVTAAITYPKIQQVPPLSVLGVGGNATAVIAPITGAASQVLVVNDAGTGLAFGYVNASSIVTGIVGVPHGGTGDSTLTAHGVLVGNGTSTVSVTTPGTGGQVLVGQTSTSDPAFTTVVGDLSLTAGGTATIATAAVTYAKFQQVAGLSVVGVTGTATAIAGAITGTAGQVLTVNNGGTSLAFGSLSLTASVSGILPVSFGGSGTGSLTAHGVLLGNGTSALTVTAAPSAGQVMIGQTTTSDPAFTTIAGDFSLTAAGTATIGTNVVTYAKIQQVAPLSVLGVSGNATANIAPIASASAYQVLQNNSGGTGLAFGLLNLTASVSGILPVLNGGSGTSALTAHGVMLGNGTSAVSVTVAPTAGQVLVGQTSTSDPVFKTLVGDVTLSSAGTATIANNAVTYAKFQQVAGLSVVGVTGTATANAAAITGTANQVLTVNSAGTGLAFGQVNFASTSAVTGNLQIANFNSGTAASTATFWRGDGTWVTPGGGGTVTSISAGTGLSASPSPITNTGTISANTATTSTIGVVTLASASDMQTGTSTTLVPTVAAVRNGNGSGWSSFKANKNGTNQTGIATSTFTQVTFSNVIYNVNSNYSSNAWTPPAGRVMIVANIVCTGTINAGNQVIIAIYKNGTIFANTNVASAQSAGGGNCVAFDVASGTDVYTAYVFITLTSGTGAVDGSNFNTYFCGTMI